MKWALAIKSALGDTWHMPRGSVAACSSRVRVDASRARDARPSDARVCTHCIRIEDRLTKVLQRKAS